MTNPIHRYIPHGTAIDLFKARDSEVLLSGPAGTGKSRACLEKVHLMCMINPNMRALVVRKTMTSLSSTGLVTFKEHVAKTHLETGELKWYGGSTVEPAAFKYKNGSTIVVGGMDKPTKIMSSEYDLVYVQEAIELTENDWEALTTRLRNGKVSFQQIIADTNPDMPTHWLNQRCLKGQTKIINTVHEDNPVLFQDGVVTKVGQSYIEKLDALTGVRYQRLRLGKWVAAEGLVYEEFDPSVNAHPRIIDVPSTWTQYLSVDFGYTNPFVAQWWVQDDDGRLYLNKEIYSTKGLVEDHAKMIKNNTKGTFEAIICDHDAEDRATLERHLGMRTTAAKKSVSDGIQMVSSRLKVAEDNRPRLYLCRDAVIKVDQELSDKRKPTSTLEEISGYVWNESKDQPVKEADHGMDAMRYMVAYKDLENREALRIRWV